MFLQDEISDFKMISALSIYGKFTTNNANPRPFCALSYRTVGNAVFSFNSKGRTETIETSSGDIIFVPKGLAYRVENDYEELFCIHFTADGLPLDRIIRITPDNAKTFETLFVSLVNCWHEKKPGYYYESSMMCFKILSLIHKQQKSSSVIYDTVIHNAIACIHKHFTDPELSIADLASMSALSESHFRKKFRLAVGVSPLQYINDLRCSYAVELLESKFYKVYEVAEMSGFNDSKYFSTVIKKRTGKSPIELVYS